jgi:hypothetical protein
MHLRQVAEQLRSEEGRNVAHSGDCPVQSVTGEVVLFDLQRMRGVRSQNAGCNFALATVR